MMHRLDKQPHKGRLYNVGKIDGKTRILDLGIRRKVHYGEFPNVKRLQERGLFQTSIHTSGTADTSCFVVYHCIAFRFIRLFLFC